MIRYKKEKIMNRADGYVSIGKASAMLCVCRDTLRKWVDTGKIKSFVTPTRHRKILLEDINKILNNGEK